MQRVERPLVLAIAPSTRGFAFILFLDPTDPIDWGIKEVRGSQKNVRCLGETKKLLRRYQPDVVVTEAYERLETKRGPRIRSLLRDAEGLAVREGAIVVTYTRADVQRTFDPKRAVSRPEIARQIAQQIPALAMKLPPPRQIWMGEDPRQSLFDAAALGLTYTKRL
jgi:hypothetical protein